MYSVTLNFTNGTKQNMISKTKDKKDASQFVVKNARTEEICYLEEWQTNLRFGSRAL
jgi:hypothetical protein